MALSVPRLPLRWISIGKRRSCLILERGRSLQATQTRSMAMASTSDDSSYVFDPPRTSSLPVVGSNSRFPVRRVYCVGKNYAAHVVEMGGDLERSNPVFFTKPSFGGVVYAGSPELNGDEGNVNDSNDSTAVKYPPNTCNLHYEVELVVAIGKELGAKSTTSTTAAATPISASELLDCVYGYAVGIDLTRRDLQGEAKSKGLPWDTGKYFDQSAPMGPITPAATLHETSFEGTLDHQLMELTVNGETKQSVRLKKMIWKVPEIIAELTKSFVLKPGDLIMTGTPSGVGPVVQGDRLVGTIEGLVQGVDITMV